LFDTLYLSACCQARVGLESDGEGQFLIPAAFADLVREEVVEGFTLIKSGMPATTLHRQVMFSLRASLIDLRSEDTCYCCIGRRPQFTLPCEHSVCENCVMVFGQSSEDDPGSFRVESCFICSNSAKTNVRVKPSTASIRVLSIDGGGTRGIIPLEFIRALEDRVALPHYSVQRNFDVIYGTSSGKPATITVKCKG